VLLFGLAHKHGGSSALTIVIVAVVGVVVLVLRGGMLLRLLIRAWTPRGKRQD
jgi:putative effector of murein hydrolase